MFPVRSIRNTAPAMRSVKPPRISSPHSDHSRDTWPTATVAAAPKGEQSEFMNVTKWEQNVLCSADVSRWRSCKQRWKYSYIQSGMIFNLSWVYLTPTWVWEMCSGYGCNRLAQCLSKLFRGLKHHETDAVMDTRRQQRGSSWKGWTVRRSRNEWKGKACFHYRNFEIKCLMGVNLTFFMKLHRSGHVYITYICDVRCQVILCMQVLFICMGSVLLHMWTFGENSSKNKQTFFFLYFHLSQLYI